MCGWLGRCWSAAVVMVCSAGSVLAVAPKPLLDVAAPRAEQRLKAAWGCEQQVSSSRSANPSGVILNVRPGQSQYPAAELKPEGAASWDLSAYDHVEARVVNTGPKAAVFALRVDNSAPGQQDPWNTEQVTLQPGQAGTVSVVFGCSYGHKPGYPLQSNAVVGITMFTMKSDAPQSFRIERLVAAGPEGAHLPASPGERAAPGQPRTRALLGAASAGGEGGVRIVLREGNSTQAAVLKPASGQWDLHEATEIRVLVKNEGTAAITPRMQATSDGNGATDVVPAARVLGPGEECEIVVPLAASAAPGSAKFRSDAVTSIRIMAERTGSATMRVRSMVAIMP